MMVKKKLIKDLYVLEKTCDENIVLDWNSFRLMFKDDSMVQSININGDYYAFMVLNQFDKNEHSLAKEKWDEFKCMDEELFKQFMDSKDKLYIEDVVSLIRHGLSIMVKTMPYYPEFMVYHGRVSNYANSKLYKSFSNVGYRIVFYSDVLNHLGGEKFQFVILKK
jgi:hypothetical protein